MNFINSIMTWGDNYPYLSHSFIALFLIVAACLVGLNPLWTVSVIAMWFYSRAVRENEYDVNKKYIGAMFPWNWSPKLMVSYVSPAIVSLLFAIFWLAMKFVPLVVIS